MKRSRNGICLGIASAMLLLTACGETDNLGDDGATAGADGAENGTDDGTDDGTGDGGEPSAGGELTMGVGLELNSFDPFDGQSHNYIITKTLYSYLIVYDENLEPQPDLAESWAFNDEQTSVTIELREASFSDGSEVTANDVVTGIERAQDPDIGLTQAGVATFISGAEAEGERTVRVDFDQPTSEDRVLDWMFYFPVVQAERNHPNELETEGAGSGPFMVESYDPGIGLVLVPNPHYYDEDKPYLDRLEYRLFQDQDALVSALQSGDVDATAWQEQRYDAQLEGQFQLVDGSEAALTMLVYLNPQIEPFDDRDCRLSVIRALDRDRIRQTVQGDDGQIVPGPFPPTSPAYDDSLLDEVAFDLEAAEAGIQEHCSSMSAEAVAQPSPGVREGMTIFQSSLAEVGFDLQVQNLDGAAFGAGLRDGQGHQTAMFTTVNPFRSAASLSTNRGFSGGEQNYWWGDLGVPDDYVAALEAVQSATDDQQVQDANDQFNEALLNNIWTSGIYTQVSRFALAEHVHGFDVSPADHLLMHEVYLDE